jgi:hypothetical protein
MITITLSVATTCLGLVAWFAFLKGQINSTHVAYEEFLREGRYLDELTSGKMVAYQVLFRTRSFSCSGRRNPPSSASNISVEGYQERSR